MYFVLVGSRNFIVVHKIFSIPHGAVVHKISDISHTEGANDRAGFWPFYDQMVIVNSLSVCKNLITCKNCKENRVAESKADVFLFFFFSFKIKVSDDHWSFLH